MVRNAKRKIVDVAITESRKPAGGKGGQYKFYKKEQLSFHNMDDFEKYLKKTFGNARRSVVYTEGKSGKNVTPIKTGYIYRYKTEEYDHRERTYVVVYVQDWVKFEVRGKRGAELAKSKGFAGFEL